MLEKAELTLIIMLSKTKKVITTHLIVLCSVASRKLFYSIAWRVGTLSLQFVPPAEGGGMEIIMNKKVKIFAAFVVIFSMIMCFAGCGNDKTSNNPSSNSIKKKINIEDIAWNVDEGIVDGDRYVLLELH